MKHRVGFVGAGYISSFHAAALRRLSNVELCGVCDVDTDRAKAAAQKLGVPAFTSLGALRDAGATSIHVLTPPHTHAAITLEALEKGCHVLVEKPLAVDADDCELIERRAREAGLQVCVNHSLLFDPHVRKALAAVRSGKLGRIVSLDILRSSVYPPYGGGPLPPQYRTAGYPFRDLGVHALYLFEAFLGPIKDVHADWSSLGGDPNLAFDEWRAQVRCRDGMGQFQLSWNVKPLQSQIIIQGTKGVLRVDLFLMFSGLRKSMPVPKPAERVLNAVADSLKPMADVTRGVYGVVRRKVLPYHGLQDLVAEFYAALDRGGEVPVPPRDATQVVRWTEQIARAADLEHVARVNELKLSDSVPFLVTGASGSLGRAVVDRLRSEGHRVRILVRRIPTQIPQNVEVALGDLGDPDAVDRAVRGAQTVIHVGAAMKGGEADHQAGTITGTRNVLDSSLKHHVKKLVHISSLSVVEWAGAPDNAVISESSPLEPRAGERGHYTRSKLQAELLVKSYSQEKGLPSVILRPGQIFGGSIPLMTPAVARRRGEGWIVLGDGEMRLPLVYIDDVVDAVMAAARSQLMHGEVIQLVDPEQFTQNQVIEMALGKEASVKHVPLPVLLTLGGMSELMLRPLKRPSPLSRYRLHSALSRRRFVNENTGLLGWSPRVGVREGIRRAMDKKPSTTDMAEMKGIKPTPRANVPAAAHA